MDKYIKYVPIIVLFVGIIGTFSVLQYKLEVVSENVKDIQKNLSDIVIQSAITEERIKNIKEDLKDK